MSGRIFCALRAGAGGYQDQAATAEQRSAGGHPLGSVPAVAGLKDRQQMIADTNAEQILQLIRGYWVSQIVGTLAAFDIPEKLANAPIRHDELAKIIDCDPDATHRLLRASAN